MTNRFYDKVMKAIKVIVLIALSALYLYGILDMGRYKSYYNQVVKSLEGCKGMSTPDFTIMRVNGCDKKMMVITLNKNMKSSLDAGRKK